MKRVDLLILLVASAVVLWSYQGTPTISIAKLATLPYTSSRWSDGLSPSLSESLPNPVSCWPDRLVWVNNAYQLIITSTRDAETIQTISLVSGVSVSHGRWPVALQCSAEQVVVMMADFSALSFDVRGGSASLLWDIQLPQQSSGQHKLGRVDSVREAAVLVAQNISLHKGDKGAVFFSIRLGDKGGLREQRQELENADKREDRSWKKQEMRRHVISHPLFVFAVDASTGDLRWASPSLSAESLNAASSESLVATQRMQMIRELKAHHPKERPWEDYAIDILESALPHSWQSASDSYITSAHFNKAHSRRRETGNDNVLVVHNMHGVSILHLYSGHGVSRVEMTSGAYADLNGDGYVENIRTKMPLHISLENGGAVSKVPSHRQGMPCSAQSKQGIPPMFPSAVFAVCDGTPQDVSAVEPLIIRLGDHLNRNSLHEHHVAFLLSSGSLSVFDANGKLLWRKKDSAAAWRDDGAALGRRPSLTGFRLDAKHQFVVACGETGGTVISAETGSDYTHFELSEPPVEVPAVVGDLLMVPTRVGIVTFRLQISKGLSAVMLPLVAIIFVLGLVWSAAFIVKD